MRPSPAAGHSRPVINWHRLRRHLWSTVALVLMLRLSNAAVFVGDPPDLTLELAGIVLGGWLASTILVRPASALADGTISHSNQQRTQTSKRG